MKTGTIVYLAGASQLPAEFDVDAAIEHAGLDPRWTEAAGAAPGFYDPLEAALALARKGAGRVELAKAAFEARQGLVVGRNRVRLAG